jgi:hypothetical protein
VIKPENIFVLTIIFGCTKHQEIRKTFSNKYFTPKKLKKVLCLELFVNNSEKNMVFGFENNFFVKIITKQGFATSNVWFTFCFCAPLHAIYIRFNVHDNFTTKVQLAMTQTEVSSMLGRPKSLR